MVPLRILYIQIYWMFWHLHDTKHRGLMKLPTSPCRLSAHRFRHGTAFLVRYQFHLGVQLRNLPMRHALTATGSLTYSVTASKYAYGLSPIEFGKNKDFPTTVVLKIQYISQGSSLVSVMVFPRLIGNYFWKYGILTIFALAIKCCIDWYHLLPSWVMGLRISSAIPLYIKMYVNLLVNVWSPFYLGLMCSVTPDAFVIINVLCFECYVCILFTFFVHYRTRWVSVTLCCFNLSYYGYG